MDDKLVSIIIPVWNHAHQAIDCLAFLEKQTYRNFEVIMVDDGSTDDVASSVQMLTLNFPFAFIRFEQNRGADAARNEGARYAKGAFFLFLDADTMLEPHALKLMVRELDAHPAAAFVYSSFYFGWKLFRGQPFDPDALKKTNYIHTSSLLRAEAFPGFDESLKKFQDWDLWLTITERGGRGYWIEEPLFKVIPRQNGMSHWLPKIAYKIPWPIFGFIPKEIRRYRDAESIIRSKHAV
ncbi:MAG TPA: glycosyltransferase family A protein [Patescibacteria group bacterium]|nr:glycosyltransferase family A protein [Patescibacteria group bacterium]